jgi:hypothetical protein
MQQRRPRPGDILDDYCPRERRVTNHVVVAMIEEGVKQTRCSTCDTEHEYKEAKAPVLRRKVAAAVVAAAPVTQPADAQDASEDAMLDSTTPTADSALALAESADEPERRDDDGSVHRRLIRATLPRPEGHVPERRPAEFTIRQPGSRGREGDGNRGGRPRGPRGPGAGQGYAGDSSPRFGGPRHGSSGAGGSGGFGGRPGNPDGQRGGRPPGPQGQAQGQGSRPGAGPGRKRGR